MPPSSENTEDMLLEALSSLSHRLSTHVQEGEHTTDSMIVELYDDLRALARSHLNKIPPGNSLFATGLVHEAFMKLASDQVWDGKGHFFGAAAQAMRQVLVDRTRRKMSLKRGGGKAAQELGEQQALTLTVSNEDLLALDDALQVLESEDQRRALIVKMRYFLGLTLEEIATQLEVSTRTVRRDWQLAKAALHALMGSGKRTLDDES